MSKNVKLASITNLCSITILRKLLRVSKQLLIDCKVWKTLIYIHIIFICDILYQYHLLQKQVFDSSLIFLFFCLDKGVINY